MSRVHADSSTGSELKAVEEACREASRTVEAFRTFQHAGSPSGLAEHLIGKSLFDESIDDGVVDELVR
jgi:hypothetical protein